MSTLRSKLMVGVDAALASALDLATAAVPLSYQYKLDLTSGTGAQQADLIFHDERTLAASASENLDVVGALVDALGATISCARIKGLVVAAAAGNTNDVVVGGVASNGFVSPFGDPTDKVKVRPGGVLALFAPGTGYVCTAGTADLLQVANGSSGTPVTYRVVLIGASA